MFGEAEIEEFDALFGDEDVGGFQVAVGDAFAVGGVEGVQNLFGVFDGLRYWQGAFERGAFD